MIVNEQVAIDHGLKKEEYKKICELLKRIPNITELGIFSAMWNEHCSYKSSRLHLKKLPTKENKLFKGLVKMQALLILAIMMRLYSKLKVITTHLLLNLIKEQRLELAVL